MLQVGIPVLFFFFIFVLTLTGVGHIFWPFSGSLFTAFCLAITFYPLYRELKRRWPRGGDSLRAILLVLGVLLVIVIPLSLIGWILVAESAGFNKVVHSWSSTLGQWSQGNFGTHLPWMNHLQDLMHRYTGLGAEDIQQRMAARIGGVLESITHYGAEIAQHTLTFVFHIFLMLFALFFFFRDGSSFCDQLAFWLPLTSRDSQALFQKIQDTVVGVLRGWLLTSMVQGVLATIGYFLAGLEGAILLGVMTAFIGLLPVIGTFGVWVPIVVFLLFKGMIGKAIFVSLWGALIVVGLVDTLIRPYFVGQRLELPLFFLFFGLLGGVEAFGIAGIVLGPLLIALTPLLLDMYRHHYRPTRIAAGHIKDT